MITATAPLRVLHVVGAMNRGGVETWLKHVAYVTDRARIQTDFLVHTTEQAAYDDELRALGCRILPCLHPARPLEYRRNLLSILRTEGPFDVVHSHVHHYCGWVLRAAAKAGVPIRVAHSHNDTSAVEAGAGLLRRAYLGMMTRWLRRYSTARVAASRQAGDALFGPPGPGNPPWSVLYCGIDLGSFHRVPSRTEARATLGLGPDAFAVGHIGRFMEQKNHAFLIRIAAELAKREPALRLLLIGDGPLRADIERQAAEAGLHEQVRFLGSRSDVPTLLAAMDAFAMPSLYEGLPLVGMEVQAAGLPFFLSDTVTPEVDVVPELVQRLSLKQSPAEWADALLAARHAPPTVSRAAALARVEDSPFNIRNSVRELEALYAGRRGG